MKSELLHKLTGIFKNCEIEPSSDGWSVFDSKKRFLGIINTHGLAITDKHEHSDKLKEKLNNEGIPFWSYDLQEDLVINEIDEEIKKLKSD